MNITRVRLKHFQKHEDQVFKFGPGVTCIYGPSDVGKSSIIRAIRWCLFGEPQGDQFIREGEKTASVRIKFDNGLVIKREKGGSVNRYTIITPDKKKQVLDNFGKGVPEIVYELTGIRKGDIAGEDVELSLASQNDGPFLLDRQSSYRSNVINTLCGNDLVSDIVSDLNKEVVNRGRDIATAEKQLNHINEQMKEYDGLEDLLTDQEILEKKVKSARKLAKWICQTEELEESLVEILEVIKEETKKELVVLETDPLEREIELLTEMILMADQLYELGDMDCESQCTDIDVEILEDGLDGLMKIWSSSIELDDVDYRHDKAQKRHKSLDEEYKELMESLDKVLEDIEVCPTCNQEIKDPHLICEGMF